MPRAAINGIEVNYREEGDGDDLVLIHNLTSNIQGLSRNIPVLAERYRTIAADLRGHGYTTHEEAPERAAEFYTFDNIVDDHLELLDKLGVDRFFLFGQAFWGANSALHLLERVPERVRAVVVSSSYIISTEPGHMAYESLDEAGRRNFIRMHELARAEGMLAVYEDRKEHGQFWSEKVRNDAETLAEFEDAHRLTSPSAFVTMPMITHERRARIAATLREHQIPLMMLLGEYEHNAAQFIEEMRRDYPDTHAAIIPDSGHYPTVENPTDFNRLLLNFYAGAERSERG